VVGLGSGSQNDGGSGLGLSAGQKRKHSEGQEEQSTSGSRLSHQGLGHSFLSGVSQRGPHGMRASGLSPFIFAMRVSPFLVKGAR
jgi:hypothetical protein